MSRILASETNRESFISASLWTLFESVALECGDCPAILEGPNRWNYSELRDRSIKIAERLVPYLAGTGGERVTVDVGLNAGTAAAILGVLRAGGIVVPLDPSNPPGYRRGIIEETVPVVHLDGQSGSLSPAFLPFPSQEAGGGGEDLSGISMLLWTSGSTGKPKGVALPGEAFASESWNCIRDYGLRSGERVGWTASPSFAGGMAVFFSAILGGAALVPGDLRGLGIDGTQEWLRGEKVSVFRPPVSFYRQWVRTLSPGEIPEPLRMVALGGQSLQWKDFESFKGRFPEDRVLVHRYACTEASLISHGFFGGGNPFPAEGTVPLGKCPEGIRVVILGEDGNPLPPGRTGQIGVVGRCLCKGYWNRPELTGERFVRLENGERLYKTGDLGHFLPGGVLALAGRLDGQVKIRGFRVEPLRVEESLLKIPGIGEAAVQAWSPPSSPEEQVLVGYVVPSGGSRPTADSLRRSLAAELPDYMIPGRFLVLPALPRTSGGKVDRSRLPEPQPGRPGLSVPFVPPEGTVEQNLANLWQEILGVKPIGALDDFFDLGGHSVQAALLFGQMEAVFGIRLPLWQLYRGRTIRDMASLLAGKAQAEWSCVIPIRTGGGVPLFLVHGLGGNAIGFGPLADRLHGYDVYGIQALGLQPRSFPHLSVTEMAAHYIREMRQVQHEGPFRLAGYSFGGVVAYEMACQLEASGETVAFLGLLDRRALRMKKTGTLKECAVHFWNDGTRRLKLALRIPVARLLLALGFPVPFMQKIMRGAIKRMDVTYHPETPYGGAMDLFLVEKGTGVADDPARAWAPFAAGPIRLHPVMGTHHSMLEEPHVRSLAEALELALAGDAAEG